MRPEFAPGQFPSTTNSTVTEIGLFSRENEDRFSIDLSVGPPTRVELTGLLPGQRCENPGRRAQRTAPQAAEFFTDNKTGSMTPNWCRRKVADGAAGTCHVGRANGKCVIARCVQERG
jgi:hypothetical protein